MLSPQAALGVFLAAVSSSGPLLDALGMQRMGKGQREDGFGLKMWEYWSGGFWSGSDTRITAYGGDEGRPVMIRDLPAHGPFPIPDTRLGCSGLRTPVCRVPPDQWDAHLSSG